MAASLVNLLGYTTGAILYAMLFWMVLRSSSDRLSLLTGALGVIWNVGAFSGYALPGVGILRPSPIVLAIAFSALGFLPAVVVHSVLRSRAISARSAGRSVLMVAYTLSFVAAVLHIGLAVRDHISPSHAALQILTVGFILVIIVLLLSTRKEAGWRQSLWVLSLAVFAVSALHLSNHSGTDPWWVALIGHHSSLLLALAFLHQDYRFALADIFLKQAVALVLLVSVVFGFYLVSPAPSGDQRSILLLLAMWVATALVYPRIRSMASWFVDTVVLHRADYDMLAAEAARSLSQMDNTDSILEEILRPAAFRIVGALGWLEYNRHAGSPVHEYRNDNRCAQRDYADPDRRRAPVLADDCGPGGGTSSAVRRHGSHREAGGDGRAPNRRGPHRTGTDGP